MTEIADLVCDFCDSEWTGDLETATVRHSTGRYVVCPSCVMACVREAIGESVDPSQIVTRASEENMC